ncbi:MAG: hypothetical protein JW828_12225 [Sedimentisphaerales bacterium]|nr:hypothetical protein [Sedimentisphaerales bacterium]
MNPVEVLIVTTGDSALQSQLPVLVESVGLRWRFCPTVYEAAAQILDPDRTSRLVIAGALVELSREKYRFVDLATARRDCLCCILAGRSTDAEGLTTAIRRGAAISASVADLAKAVRRAAEELDRRMQANRSPGREYPEGRGGMELLSEAELEALLGEKHDEKSKFRMVQ